MHLQQWRNEATPTSNLEPLSPALSTLRTEDVISQTSFLIGRAYSSASCFASAVTASNFYMPETGKPEYLHTFFFLI